MSAYCSVAGDEVLLRAELVRVLAKEVLRGLLAGPLHGGQALARPAAQFRPVDGGKQAGPEAVGAGLLAQRRAAVVDGVALAPAGDQPRAGEDLQVVAHGRLADVEDGAQFLHRQGVLPQHLEDFHAQAVAAGLAQRGQLADAGGRGVRRARPAVGGCGFCGLCVGAC